MKSIYTTVLGQSSKNTLKLLGYEVDGAGIIIDMTMSFECVYKPCEVYKTNAFKWG